MKCGKLLNGKNLIEEMLNKILRGNMNCHTESIFTILLMSESLKFM